MLKTIKSRAEEQFAATQTKEKKAKRAVEKKEAREKKSRQSQPSAQSDGQNPLSPTTE
jgi:hypothetical protein